MFTEHFGFKQNPFTSTEEPAFFYTSPERKRICQQILNDIQNSFSPIILTGQSGVGKTTFLQELAYHLQPHFHCIKPVESQLNYAARVSASLEQLAQSNPTSKKIVLLVDDANEIPNADLKLLLLLTKHHVNKEYCSSFQMVWCGDASLNRKLTKLDGERYQNYPFFYHLIGLNKTEVSRYIDFRLEQVGYKVPNKLFSPMAIDKITELSQGLPRSINRLCNKTLELAYEQHVGYVTEELVAKAANVSSLPSDVATPPTNLNHTLTSNTGTALPKKITIRIQINKTEAADLRSAKQQQKPTGKTSKNFWLYAGSLAIGFCVTSLASYQYLDKVITFFTPNPEPKLAVQAPPINNIIQIKTASVPGQQSKPIANTPNPTHLSKQRTPTKSAKPTPKGDSSATQVAYKKPSLPPPVKRQQANITATAKPDAKVQPPALATYKMQPSQPLLKQRPEKKEGAKNTNTVKAHPKSTGHPAKQLVVNPPVNKPIPHNSDTLPSSITKAEKIDAQEAAARDRAANRLRLDRLGIEFSPDSLVAAAEKGDLLATRLLIKGGIPYNVKNKQGKTALMVSAKNGHKHIIDELLKKKIHAGN